MNEWIKKIWHKGNWIFSSVQSLSCAQLFVPHWLQYASFPSITSSRSVLKLMSVKLVMPSIHLILCCPLLLLPSVFPRLRVFSRVSVLCIRWPKYWVLASAAVLPMNIQDRFPLGLTGLISLLSEGLSRVFSSTTIQKHQFIGTQPSLCQTVPSVHDYWKSHSFD